MEESWEKLTPSLRLCVSREHTFGADALLLSDFAAPRSREIACDLGAGCGIVAARWFRRLETAPELVWAVELQRQAFEQMALSVAAGGLPKERFLPLLCDLRDLPSLTRRIPAGSVDLVACNPPYFPVGSGRQSVVASARLARHGDFCTETDVCAAAARLLRFGGRLCVCLKPERLAEMICAMRAVRLEPKRLQWVQSRQSAAPRLCLLEGRLGGKASLRMLPPLVERRGNSAAIGG